MPQRVYELKYKIPIGFDYVFYVKRFPYSLLSTSVGFRKAAFNV